MKICPRCRRAFSIDQDPACPHNYRMTAATRRKIGPGADQRSLTEQMGDLVQWANQNGFYDAADWLGQHFPWPGQPPPDIDGAAPLTGAPGTIPAAGGLLWPHGERIEP